MKLILTQIARLLGAVLVLYGALLGATLLLVPRPDVGLRLDAGRAASSLYMTEPKYVFMSRSRLNSTSDKVLLLGASNMLVGFKQAEVQALLPRLEVHNLSVGGSNISQIEQIHELVREVQTPEARRHNIYVIGLWYGLFASDQARWYTPDRNPGDTDIDIERYRYGFFRRTEAGAVAVLPPQHLDVGVLLIHPYLVLDRVARHLTRSLRGAISAQPPSINDAQRDAVVLSDAQKRNFLDFWHAYMGGAPTFDDAPFLALERLVDGILVDGGRVVLVDMPIPAWHARGSVHAADYRPRVDLLLERLRTRDAVVLLQMTDADDESEFSDEVHPKPRVTKRWAQRLAVALQASAGLAGVQAASAR
jgi:hypothetical protein